jgi:hypothetical protein
MISLGEEGDEATVVVRGEGEAVEDEDGGSGWSAGIVVREVKIDDCRH